MKLIIIITLVFSSLLLTAQRGSAVEISLEAESAVLNGPMKVSPDGQAFNNLCIEGYKVNRRGWATFTVNIPVEGDYIMWGRIHARDGFANSFYVSVDKTEPFIWDVNKSNRWEWDRVSDRGIGSTAEPSIDPMMFHFEAGEHTFTIGNRERDTRLDRIIITDDLEKRYYDEPTRWIKLDAPEMADVLEPGSLFEFKWHSRFISDVVNIDLSFDRGATFTIPVVHGTENDGSYVWQVPEWFNRAKLVARISDATGLSYDVNRGFFSAVDPQSVSLMLKNPSGGELLTPGSRYVIRWNEFSFNGFVAIYSSIDNGKIWSKITENENAAGEFHWWVPDTPSDSCLIKIADSKDGEPSDISKANFSIAQTSSGEGTAMAKSGNISTALPDEFILKASYPNPFNPQTTLTYGVAETRHVSLSIYDMLGRQIEVLVEAEQEPGWYQIVWNGEDVPSGVYSAIFKTGEKRFVQRLTLMK